MRTADTEWWALGAVFGSLAVAANLFLTWFGVDAGAFSAAARLTGFDAFWGAAGSVLIVIAGIGAGLIVLLRVDALRKRLPIVQAVAVGGLLLVVSQVVVGHLVAGTFRLDRHVGAYLGVVFGAITVAAIILATRSRAARTR